jgi:hypothetical protein
MKKSLRSFKKTNCKKLKTLKRSKNSKILKKKKTIKKSMVHSKKLSGLFGGFKFNEINETGNNGFITSCIPCCSLCDCPTDKSGNVSIVTKIFFNTPEGTLKYLKEVEIGNLLKRIDPNQNRFVYSLPKSTNCSTCTIKIKELDPSIQKVLRKVDPSITDDDTISNFKYFNMMAINMYENVSAIPEHKKEFLKESLEILHANGICHLDLHKLNILEGNDLYPRIIDFGESYIFDPTNVTELDIENMKKDRTTLSITLRKTPNSLKRRSSFKRSLSSSPGPSPRRSLSPRPSPGPSPRPSPRPSPSKLFDVNIFGLPRPIRYNSPVRKITKTYNYDSPPTRVQME